MTMARPKKAANEVRDNRLTIYLTDNEKESLHRVSEAQNRPMTQLVNTAVQEWLNRLIEPPEGLRTARYENIMEQDTEMLRGFICRNGHPFWVEWVQPTNPRCCPVCGSEREIRRIWDGTIRKGF